MPPKNCQQKLIHICILPQKVLSLWYRNGELSISRQFPICFTIFMQKQGKISPKFLGAKLKKVKGLLKLSQTLYKKGLTFFDGALLSSFTSLKHS